MSEINVKSENQTGGITTAEVNGTSAVEIEAKETKKPEEKKQPSLAEKKARKRQEDTELLSQLKNETAERFNAFQEKLKAELGTGIVPVAYLSQDGRVTARLDVAVVDA